jgi:hypothetical protein
VRDGASASWMDVARSRGVEMLGPTLAGVCASQEYVPSCGKGLIQKKMLAMGGECDILSLDDSCRVGLGVVTLAKNASSGAPAQIWRGNAPSVSSTWSTH